MTDDAQDMRRFAPAGTRRLCVMRDGHAVVREWKIPKPVVLVDTREREPFSLAEDHPGWIGGERRATLKTGDYSVEGITKHFTYWWLEQNGRGRTLIDDDGL